MLRQMEAMSRQNFQLLRQMDAMLRQMGSMLRQMDGMLRRIGVVFENKIFNLREPFLMIFYVG